jgi:WD40 repeat protein
MTLSEHGSNNVLFVGRPAHFSVINRTTARPIAEITTHRQDWVYCIHPLSERSFAVVTGTELEAWGCNDTLSQWKKTAVLVSDTLGATSPGHVRPFISSVTALEGQSHLLGLSLFNSGIEGQTSVKIYDTKSENTIFESPGHQGRAWEIENLARDVFASCGDEGTIKVWDMRQKKVTFTLKDNTKEKSRVSCLLKMGDHTLVSASCPDEVRKTADKARFCIRDMRKFTGGTA